MIYVDVLMPTNQSCVLIEGGIHLVHEFGAAVCSGSKPNQKVECVAIDVQHLLYLPTLFVFIGLVDADGVDPEQSIVLHIWQEIRTNVLKRRKGFA